jgi:hypothetical protein
MRSASRHVLSTFDQSGRPSNLGLVVVLVLALT